mmetsp:Transcript_819/g.1869  ORF Transcript_819/g.1869 Transcript_819/m.1869 type:complete len:257 (+) Transcript_819:344-1114(+)
MLVVVVMVMAMVPCRRLCYMPGQGLRGFWSELCDIILDGDRQRPHLCGRSNGFMPVRSPMHRLLTQDLATGHRLDHNALPSDVHSALQDQVEKAAEEAPLARLEKAVVSVNFLDLKEVVQRYKSTTAAHERWCGEIRHGKLTSCGEHRGERCDALLALLPFQQLLEVRSGQEESFHTRVRSVDSLPCGSRPYILRQGEAGGIFGFGGYHGQQGKVNRRIHKLLPFKPLGGVLLFQELHDLCPAHDSIHTAGGSRGL